MMNTREQLKIARLFAAVEGGGLESSVLARMGHQAAACMRMDSAEPLFERGFAADHQTPPVGRIIRWFVNQAQECAAATERVRVLDSAESQLLGTLYRAADMRPIDWTGQQEIAIEELRLSPALKSDMSAWEWAFVCAMDTLEQSSRQARCSDQARSVLTTSQEYKLFEIVNRHAPAWLSRIAADRLWLPGWVWQGRPLHP